ARDPPQCVEAVHSRLRGAPVVSDCCVWRLVYPNRLLVAEHALGPLADSAHFLSSLIETYRPGSNANAGNGDRRAGHATLRTILLICRERCFVICCHSFALACRARESFRCAGPVPTSR